jgi:hypothetical protein
MVEQRSKWLTERQSQRIAALREAEISGFGVRWW